MRSGAERPAAGGHEAEQENQVSAAGQQPPAGVAGADETGPDRPVQA
jgi:hypothetical protein